MKNLFNQLLNIQQNLPLKFDGLKVTICMFLILIFSAPAFAEKIPVKLANTSLISTHHDEIQLGDYIPFIVVNNVYVNNKLYIKKNTKALGLVDFVQDNGWAGYSAEIVIKKFMTKDTQGNIITIESPITLDGKAETFESTVNYITDKGIILTIFGSLGDVFMFIRGHEIKIHPEHVAFNIFIEK